MVIAGRIEPSKWSNGMPEDRRRDPFLARCRDLAEAQCVIGDVYRSLIAYQELVARSGLDNPRRVQRFLNRLFLANEDMREWVLEQSERTREEIDLDPDFAQLVADVKEASDQIQGTIGPLLRQVSSRTNPEPHAGNSSQPHTVQVAPGAAALLANILSCLALRAQAQLNRESELP